MHSIEFFVDGPRVSALSVVTMTKKISERVFKLWPSIQKMAADLGVAPSDLIELREAGDIPAPKHDDVIVARALYEGVSITRAHLAKHRQAQVQKEKQKKVIAGLISRAGGARKLSSAIGTSENVVRLASSRGYLPRRHKYEIMMAAQSMNFVLPDDIFEPVG